MIFGNSSGHYSSRRQGSVARRSRASSLTQQDSLLGQQFPPSAAAAAIKRHSLDNSAGTQMRNFKVDPAPARRANSMTSKSYQVPRSPSTTLNSRRASLTSNSSNLHTNFGRGRTNSLTETHTVINKDQHGRTLSITTTTIRHMGSFEITNTKETPVADLPPPTASFTSPRADSLRSFDSDLHGIQEVPEAERSSYHLQEVEEEKSDEERLPRDSVISALSDYDSSPPPVPEAPKSAPKQVPKQASPPAEQPDNKRASHQESIDSTDFQDTQEDIKLDDQDEKPQELAQSEKSDKSEEVANYQVPLKEEPRKEFVSDSDYASSIDSSNHRGIPPKSALRGSKHPVAPHPDKALSTAKSRVSFNEKGAEPFVYESYDYEEEKEKPKPKPEQKRLSLVRGSQPQPFASSRVRQPAPRTLRSGQAPTPLSAPSRSPVRSSSTRGLSSVANGKPEANKLSAAAAATSSKSNAPGQPQTQVHQEPESQEDVEAQRIRAQAVALAQAEFNLAKKTDTNNSSSTSKSIRSRRLSNDSSKNQPHTYRALVDLDTASVKSDSSFKMKSHARGSSSTPRKDLTMRTLRDGPLPNTNDIDAGPRKFKSRFDDSDSDDDQGTNGYFGKFTSSSNNNTSDQSSGRKMSFSAVFSPHTDVKQVFKKDKDSQSIGSGTNYTQDQDSYVPPVPAVPETAGTAGTGGKKKKNFWGKLFGKKKH